MIGAIDTAAFVPGVGLYAFADDLVWRFSGSGLTPDRGFPKTITAEFPGTFPRRVDAAFVHPDGGLYLFRGDRYIRYDLAARRPELGYPRRFAADWPGIFPRIDAALAWSPDIVYVFAGDRYTSLPRGASGARPGFPKPIAGNWPGVGGGPVRAALTLPGDRRVLITADRAHAFDRHGAPLAGELELPGLPGFAHEGGTGSAPLSSRRFVESPARADLQAIADGKLRLGRRGDGQYPAPIRSSGPVVREVQGALVELGSPIPGGADGVYGEGTYQTVLAYKRKHNIRTDSGYLDGIVGPKTIRHLDATLPAPTPTPVSQAEDPKFTIVGKPLVTVTPEGREVSQSTATVLFRNGDFSIDAVIRAEAVQATDFEDWEVGIVQTVFDPVSHACYGPDPQTSQVLVSAIDPQGRRAVPDREQPRDRFMNSSFRSGVDLKSIHQGNLVVTRQLHAEDHPSTGPKTNIPPTTGTGSNLLLFETFRSGRIITTVIARKVSTGRIIPLHTVEWRIESRVRYLHPGTGIPLELDGPAHNVFAKIADRPFAPGDPPPVTNGKTMKELEFARTTSRRPACPTPHAQPVDPVLRWKRLLGPDCRDGNDVVELVDGAETFRAMKEAIDSAVGADHYIYLLGWWLDIAEPLDVPVKTRGVVPGGPLDCPKPPRGGPSTIANLFRTASARGVQIRVMLWDQPGKKNTAEVAFVNSLPTGAAILDNHQSHLLPLDPKASVGSQHQKILLVKGTRGLISFCGGVDINCDRICPKEVCPKTEGESFIVASSGGSGGDGAPLHDVHSRIVGPAAHDLLRVFVKRWFSTSERADLDKAKGALRGLREALPRPAGRAVVRIGETYNADATLPAGTTLGLPAGKRTFRDRTVQEILLTVLANAQRYVYIEEQYLTNLCAAEAIRRALPRLDHVTILVAASQITDMPQRWRLRKRFIDHIRTSPQANKLRVFTLCSPGSTDKAPRFALHTYTHAKMMIADDEIAVIGSANMNRRGWEHDAEVVAAIIGPGRDGTPLARKLRMRLWSEHLGVPEAAVADPITSKALWRLGDTTRVIPYNPTFDTDPFTNRLIPGGESSIDPGFELASAPCCRIHGPSCPGGKASSKEAFEAGEAEAEQLETAWSMESPFAEVARGPRVAPGELVGAAGAGAHWARSEQVLDEVGDTVPAREGTAGDAIKPGARDGAPAAVRLFPTVYADKLTADPKLQQAFDDTLAGLRARDRAKIALVPFTIIAMQSGGARPVAGTLQHEEHYSASLLKTAVMFAAFELRAAIRRLAAAVNPANDKQLATAAKAAFDSQIKAAVPTLYANRKITDNHVLPRYLSVFTTTPSVDFTPAFRSHIEGMIVHGHNSDAADCVHGVGYGYLNGALEQAGFYKSGTGIWVAGDFLGGNVYPSVRIASVNDGAVAQATTTYQMARLYDLIHSGGLAIDAVGEMDAFLGRAGTWLTFTKPPVWTAATAVTVTHAKVGRGPLKAGGEVLSEVEVVRESRRAADFAVCWQNVKPSGGVDHALLKPIGDVLEQTIARFLGP